MGSQEGSRGRGGEGGEKAGKSCSPPASARLHADPSTKQSSVGRFTGRGQKPHGRPFLSPHPLPKQQSPGLEHRQR